MRTVVLALSAAVALTACAATGPSHDQTELERLQADCAARGGVLSPTGGQSGRPQLDNVCKITSQRSNR